MSVVARWSSGVHRGRGTLVYTYFGRVAGFEHPAAYFSAMPGGLVDMVTLGLESGGDEKMIALVQAARIILVALCLPSRFGVPPELRRIVPEPLSFRSRASTPMTFLWFSMAVLLGVGAGILLRLPADYLLGPMSASAIMHVMGWTQLKLPTVARATAQVVIGATIGYRFAMAAPRKIVEVIGLSFGSTILLLSVALAFAGRSLLSRRRPVPRSYARLLPGKCRRDGPHCWSQR
ncbi:AbrB family transcriptional regulator [Ensifer aridi]|uniref:AbrB family transcriptional regulator n=1 Tax=Ensifer aridi TaxID=1708715 RepID=UPI00097BD112|nr:AbrB family transcriptional regulator [Ensifer aridi]